MSIMPITEFRDDYDHPAFSKVEYVVENVLFEPTSRNEFTTEYQNLVEQFNSVLMNPCRCSGSCDKAQECAHGNNYLEESSEFILNPLRRSHDLIYECSSNCICDETSCRNRLVQYGPRPKLEIITSKLVAPQLGLQTKARIPKGGFVCEYAGEIITRSEAIRRTKVKGNKMNYILCLNELPTEAEETPSLEGHKTFIDPSVRGNIGRYLNHSCLPNCEILSVRVDSPIPRIGIFAKKDIEGEKELCFHYGGGRTSKRNAFADNLIVCRCGAEVCEKYLPHIEF